MSRAVFPTGVPAPNPVTSGARERQGRGMAGVRWDKVFTKRYRAKGATEAELRSLVSSVLSPLTGEEVAAIAASQSNPFPASDPLHGFYKPFDPRAWRLPATPLPASYLDFLRWSNGGEFLNGDRCFSPFFAAGQVRGYLLGYNIPQYMPGAVPFAFDGGGRFYLFDMRQGPIDGEYPVLFVGAGNLGYDDAVHAGTSFIDACTRSTDPGKQYMR